MNVLRSSLRLDASPGSPPMSSTGAANSRKTSAARAEPPPLMITAVAAPCAGTDPITATSAHRSAPTSSAILGFTSGAAAFMSTYTAPGSRNEATEAAAPSAALPPTRLSTTWASRTAASGVVARVTPGGVARSAGS